MNAYHATIREIWESPLKLNFTKVCGLIILPHTFFMYNMQGYFVVQAGTVMMSVNFRLRACYIQVEYLRGDKVSIFYIEVGWNENTFCRWDETL